MQAVNGDLLVVDDLPGAFAERVIDAFQARQDEEFCFALSGGETARACYERLAADRGRAHRLVGGQRVLGRRAVRARRPS